MTVPKSSVFPEKLDDDNNLFLVHDSLRVRLSEDYNPGARVIYVEGDEKVMLKFPETGIITLTEQCSDIDLRALSFYYSSPPRSFPYSFGNLELLQEFSSLDSPKPKRATNVTMNVVDLHHNHLKDAVIKVQEFLGTKYDPEKGTINERISSLKDVALAPKAWFSSDVTYGLRDLKVTFKNESLRVGEGFTKQTWGFRARGSSSTETVVIESDGEEDYNSKTTLERVFTVPGVYTVSLEVENQYGQKSSVEFSDMIVVRTECPEEASITINHRASQNIYLSGNYPRIRSSTNTFIDLEVPEGCEICPPASPAYSFGGELLNSSGSRVDPIVEYTWKLGDDLPHPNYRVARASYDKGGYYDITLRVDTSFGAYRITSYNDAIDIVEQSNLWMFNYRTSDTNDDSSGIVQAYEFGLKSETFKTLGNSSLFVDRNNSFLSESPLNYDSTTYYPATLARAKNEFEKNVEFTRMGSADSGDKGESIMFWAKGGSTTDSREILSKKYNAFDDSYESSSTIGGRPWNWVALSSSEKTYFIFGQGNPSENAVLAERLDYDLATQSASAPMTLSAASFENGAEELLNYSSPELATSGYFASYRSAWKGQTGYILRNSSVNEFLRLGDFYKTKGNLASPFGVITRLPDMPGSIKTEGELVPLFNGVFFFNNSGEICAWNDTSLSWEVGRASATSLSFRSVQDTSKDNFDDRSNTLKAASDGDRMAYLSYDYSRKAFIKFNGTDLTFTIMRQRPEGKQFKIGVY
jgi:PKD repeat protein